MNTQRSIRLIAMLVAVMLSFSLAPLKAVVIDGVDWTYNWLGSTLPQSSVTPDWGVFGGTPVTASGTATVMVAGSGASLTPTTQWLGGASGAGPNSTLEFKTKILTAGTYGSPTPLWSTGLFAGWNGQRFQVGITSDGGSGGAIGLWNGNAAAAGLQGSVSLDTSVYHVIRLVFDDTSNLASMYVDGNFVASTVGSGGAGNDINFADFGGGVANDASSQWEYIRWTNAGAFVPVPEPASLGLLLGAGGTFGLLCLRRRRASR